MRLLGSIAIAAVLGTAATPVSATITNVIGGPGGTPFELRCPAGTVTVGVRAHAGAWIDGLRLLCSTNRRGGRQTTNAVGSDHSAVQEVYCRRGAAGRGISMTFTNGQGLEQEYLNSLQIGCSDGGRLCVDTGEGCLYIPDTAGPFSAPDPRLSTSIYCPADEVLVGLVGRAGKFVDAVGAVCRPGPGVIGDDRAAVSDLRSPKPAYQDIGKQQIGDSMGRSAPAQVIPTSPNPDVNSAPLSTVSPIPVTQNAADGMQRNVPPPIEPPH